jgi:hypothetical protein
MVHVSDSCNPIFHFIGAYYINTDTAAFIQLLRSDLPATTFTTPAATAMHLAAQQGRQGKRSSIRMPLRVFSRLKVNDGAVL